MLLKVFPDKSSLSRAAAGQAANAIRSAIAKRGHARIVAATAASQIEFLDALTKAPGIDWSKVEAFHLDEYIGLPVTHPGSFRKMLLEQLIQKTKIRKYHLLDGDANDPAEVARRIGKELASSPVDIEFLGIGENGHLAFNEPGSALDSRTRVVELAESTRLANAPYVDGPVPTHAVTQGLSHRLNASYAQRYASNRITGIHLFRNWRGHRSFERGFQ